MPESGRSQILLPVHVALPKAFLTHHVANISTAIQAADARTVLEANAHRALRQSLGLA